MHCFVESMLYCGCSISVDLWCKNATFTTNGFVYFHEISAAGDVFTAAALAGGKS